MISSADMIIFNEIMGFALPKCKTPTQGRGFSQIVFKVKL